MLRITKEMRVDIGRERSVCDLYFSTAFESAKQYIPRYENEMQLDVLNLLKNCSFLRLI